MILRMLWDQEVPLDHRDLSVNKDQGENLEIKGKRVLLAHVVEMANLVHLAILALPDPQVLRVPLDLVETLVLRWQEDLMRKLVVLRWESCKDLWDLWDHEALRDPQDLLALKDFKAALVNRESLALVVQWVPVGHPGHLENLEMMAKQANLANQESVDHLDHRVLEVSLGPQVSLE